MSSLLLCSAPAVQRFLFSALVSSRRGRARLSRSVRKAKRKPIQVNLRTIVRRKEARKSDPGNLKGNYAYFAARFPFLRRNLDSLQQGLAQGKQILPLARFLLLIYESLCARVRFSFSLFRSERNKRQISILPIFRSAETSHITITHVPPQTSGRRARYAKYSINKSAVRSGGRARE